MDDFTDRVRQRAYHIWIQEGRPEGREAAHWDMARELVAIEDNQRQAMKKVARDPARMDRAAETAEPAAPAAAMGELPTTTDEGEQIYPPSRAAARAAAATRPASPYVGKATHGAIKPAPSKPSPSSTARSPVPPSKSASASAGRSATPAAMKTQTTKSTKGEVTGEIKTSKPKTGASRKGEPVKPGPGPRNKK